jgi:hypothetical protein
MKIEQYKAVGTRHHRRASALLHCLAGAALWVDLGFLTFVACYLNVPLLQPWRDWLGSSFAATVVVVILGQTWLMRHAAMSHNHGREVFFAAVTGLLVTTLAYLSAALVGYKVSRERDSLAADLNDDLDAYLETIRNSRRDLAGLAETGDTLKDKTFPDICNTAHEAADSCSADPFAIDSAELEEGIRRARQQRITSRKGTAHARHRRLDRAAQRRQGIRRKSSRQDRIGARHGQSDSALCARFGTRNAANWRLENRRHQPGNPGLRLPGACHFKWRIGPCPGVGRFRTAAGEVLLTTTPVDPAH